MTFVIAAVKWDDDGDQNEIKENQEVLSEWLIHEAYRTERVYSQSTSSLIWINQPINQSVSQSLNQSIHRYILVAMISSSEIEGLIEKQPFIGMRGNSIELTVLSHHLAVNSCQTCRYLLSFRGREKIDWVSSAYGWYEKPCDVITSHRDPVYGEKGRGPTTEPGGTAVCKAALDVYSYSICHKQLMMKDWNHCHADTHFC